MTGWADGFGPSIPRLEGDKLYGRGGADDGYAMLGPHSNAHGPNEFLHVPTARRVSPVIAQVLADHAARSDAA
jgi:acetylornithine deacetylase/succinyl-diaminopimelate desuccinylase-like protein